MNTRSQTEREAERRYLGVQHVDNRKRRVLKFLGVVCWDGMRFPFRRGMNDKHDHGCFDTSAFAWFMAKKCPEYAEFRMRITS